MLPVFVFFAQHICIFFQWLSLACDFTCLFCKVPWVWIGGGFPAPDKHRLRGQSLDCGPVCWRWVSQSPLLSFTWLSLSIRLSVQVYLTELQTQWWVSSAWPFSVCKRELYICVHVSQPSCKPLSVICVVVFIVDKAFAESPFLAGWKWSSAAIRRLDKIMAPGSQTPSLSCSAVKYELFYFLICQRIATHLKSKVEGGWERMLDNLKCWQEINQSPAPN